MLPKNPVESALDFLWNMPEVNVVLSGMSETEQVVQNLEYANRAHAGMLTDEETAAIIGAVMLPLLVFSFFFNIFVGYPVLVGMNRFFMENRINGSKIGRIFWVFKSGNYFNVVKIMFLMNLKIFLWSLLFIIPGIVKSYEYYMVPYILAENPQISCERAFELSKQMTKGEKWKIFVLGISFIGWIIVGFLCCCVGQFFVQPYIEATYAELYQVMREKAHGLGFSDYSELPGFFPEQN